jgi:hypothetical protein
MPTAAKLAAAILFGALAWLASELAIPFFPEGAAVGRFAEWNAAIGAVIGWRVAGCAGPHELAQRRGLRADHRVRHGQRGAVPPQPRQDARPLL